MACTPGTSSRVRGSHSVRRDMMQLNLRIDNQKTVYGPNDTIQGTVQLDVPVNVLISEISVEFIGEAAYVFSPYLIFDTEHTAKQTLIQQRIIVYASDKLNPDPLPSGYHAWSFQFRFPTKETSLPPSFGHIADTAQTLKMGSSRVRVQTSGYVVYSLWTRIHGIGLPKGLPESTEGPILFFWPNRYTELPDGPFPKAHHHNITVPRVQAPVPFQNDERRLMQRMREKIFRHQNDVSLTLTAHLPRYNILGQPLQVKVSTDPGEYLLALPILRLERVQYELLVLTRIGRRCCSRQHTSTNIALSRLHKNLNTSFPEADHCIHLNNIAPVVIPVNPNWGERIGEGAELIGPLCPTFESELMSRTYKLLLYIYVSCEGKLQCRRFVEDELVLLPPRLDGSVKKPPAELLGEAIVEADEGALNDPELAAQYGGHCSRIEVHGGEVAHEIGIEHQRGIELPANDARTKE